VNAALVLLLVLLPGCIVGPARGAGGQPPRERATLPPANLAAARERLELGRTLAGAGRYDQALAVFQEVLGDARSAGDLALQAHALHDIGAVYYDTGAYAAAQGPLEDSLAIFEALPDLQRQDRGIQAFALARLLGVYRDLGRPDDLIAVARKGVPVFQEIGDFEAVISAYGLAGMAYAELGNFETAIAMHEEAVRIAREVGDRDAEALALQVMAQAYEQAGRKGEAAEARGGALEAARASGEQVGAFTVLYDLAVAEQSLGHYDSALAHLRDALDVARASGNRSRAGDALHLMGVLYRTRGEYDLGNRAYREALALRRDLGERRKEAVTLNNLGSLLTVQGKYDEAREVLTEALILRREVGDAEGEARTLHNLAALEVASNAAGTDLLSPSAEATSFDPPEFDYEAVVDEAKQLSNRGSAYLLEGRFEEASNAFAESLELRRSAGDRLGEGLMLTGLGVVHQLRGEAEAALEHYRDALTIFADLDVGAEESAVLALSAALHLQAGDLERAFSFTERAVALKERVRSAQLLEESRTLLSEEAATLYDAAVTLASQLDRPDEAFTYAERARARSFLDQLGSALPDVLDAETATADELRRLSRSLADLERERHAEIARGAAGDPKRAAELNARTDEMQRRYGRLLEQLKLQDPEYASLLAVAPLTLEEVQGLLPEAHTLISYFVTRHETFAFVLHKDRFDAVALGVGEEDVTALLTAFRAGFAGSPGQAAPPGPGPLADLHRLLVQPLVGRGLLTTRHLVIVPHGVLHSLPFAALWSEADRSYLGDAYSLSYLPSASVLPFVRQKLADNPDRQRLLALAQTRPVGFPYLASAAQEAREAAAIYGTTAHIDREATEARFKNEASGKDVILLAAHGELSDANPLLSRIVLAADDAGREDGFLSVQEVYALDLSDANLVVLSACETNGGALTRGDDLVGLTRAFMYAGAPSVVASLWKVDDEATRILVTSLLSRYKAGLSAAEALQAAQADVRMVPGYAHPYYWAAFVLIGGP
jgi:tetratricopeptide (TPR) repeat protein